MDIMWRNPCPPVQVCVACMTNDRLGKEVLGVLGGGNMCVVLNMRCHIFSHHLYSLLNIRTLDNAEANTFDQADIINILL